MDYRTTFERAWREQQAARKIGLDAMLESVGRAFHRLSGQLADKVVIEDGGVVVCVGQHAFMHHGPGHAWSMLGECPLCSAECWSNPFTEAWRAGQLMEDFEPGGGHVCEPEEEEEKEEHGDYPARNMAEALMAFLAAYERGDLTC